MRLHEQEGGELVTERDVSGLRTRESTKSVKNQLRGCVQSGSKWLNSDSEQNTKLS